MFAPGSSQAVRAYGLHNISGGAKDDDSDVMDVADAGTPGNLDGAVDEGDTTANAMGSPEPEQHMDTDGIPPEQHMDAGDSPWTNIDDNTGATDPVVHTDALDGNGNELNHDWDHPAGDEHEGQDLGGQHVGQDLGGQQGHLGLAGALDGAAAHDDHWSSRSDHETTPNQGTRGFQLASYVNNADCTPQNPTGRYQPREEVRSYDYQRANREAQEQRDNDRRMQQWRLGPISRPDRNYTIR